MEIFQGNVRAKIQEAHRQVGKLTEQNTQLHGQLVQEINTNYGLRWELKELKKTIRSLIQEVDQYHQQHQQQCATMKEYMRRYN
jgi:regulator of replication initiation timing